VTLARNRVRENRVQMKDEVAHSRLLPEHVVAPIRYLAQLQIAWPRLMGASRECKEED
jgi:hypothetical protein